MSSSRLGNIVGGIIFLALAIISGYRLLFWFPITIGGHLIGQTASFFAFVISAALCLILLLGGREKQRR
jgi:hypothetical protein